MTEKDALKILDDILSFLYSQDNYTSTKNQVKSFVKNNNFFFKNKEGNDAHTIANNSINVSKETNKYFLKIDEAISYLSRNSFIKVDGEELSLNFEGIIQHPKSFVKEHGYKTHKSILDIYNVYISIGLTVIGLIVGYILG